MSLGLFFTVNTHNKASDKQLVTNYHQALFMPKNLLFFFGFFICFQPSFGQSALIGEILEKPSNFIGTIEMDRPNTVYLQCNYASPVILNLQEIEQLKGKAIIKVELIYTTHKEVMTFDQLQLNKNRLINLEKAYPELYKNTLIKWEVTGQTDCKSRQIGQGFFHGFLITYRPPFTKEDTEKEIAFIERMLSESAPSSIAKGESDESKSSITKPKTPEEIEKSLGLDSPPSFKGGEEARLRYVNKHLEYPVEAIRHGVSGMVITSFLVGPSGSIEDVGILKGLDESCNREVLRVVRNMPPWNPGYKNGKPVPIYYTMPIMFVIEDKDRPEPMFYAGKPALDTTAQHLNTIEVDESVREIRKIYTKRQEEDSAVYHILKRNPQWKDMLIVCDLTGSMSPYTTQTLNLMRLEMQGGENRIKHFTFFNDGDNMQDRNKKIGRTGGIYHQEATTFDEVKAEAIKAMYNGSGGDLPENNLEATIEAIQACPDCEDIIWIADNYATPRDLSLLSKIKKPIHIILCGTYYGVNMEYLTLALQNGGSVHTMAKDLNNLNELGEGEEIEVGYQKFQRRQNWFEPFYDY